MLASKITVSVLKGFSRLPLGALYAFSTFLAWIMEHVVRYRSAVIEKNLADSFPEKTAAELKQIKRDFYRNFCDLAVEMVKMPRMDPAEMKRRMEFVNTDIYDGLVDQGKSTAVYLAHLFNWEWGTSITQWINRQLGSQVVFAQIYRPLRNRDFDDYLLQIRSRFGARSFKKATVLRELLRYRQLGIPTVSGFLSDQKPSHGDLVHVVDFLNHPTAIITGTEQLARKLKMAVVFWDMEKISRGHYRVTSRLITTDASQEPSFSITDQYAAMLEKSIRRNPALWLWSHKRWKHPVTHADDNTTHLGNNSKL